MCLRNGVPVVIRTFLNMTLSISMNCTNPVNSTTLRCYMKSTLFYLEQQDYCLIDRGQLDLRRKSVRKCSPFSTDFWNCLRLSVRCSGCHLSLQCFRHPLLLLVLEGPRLHPAYSSFKLAFPFSVYASWNLPTL